MIEPTEIESIYRTYRSYALSIAYRMLGTFTDAEDVVQDLFAELANKDMTEILNMKSYIAKSVTNRCLNLMHSAKKTREEYVGEWLPEPVSGTALLPELAAEQKDTLSYAYLLMLERLGPVERAVFLLREVFEYEYHQIAEMTGKTEANCRKIFSRSKQQLKAAEMPAISYESGQRRAMIERFADAFQHYDAKELLRLLAEDAVLISDGGGASRTATRPIVSRERLLRLFTSPKAYRDLRTWKACLIEINGEINIVYMSRNEVQAVLCFRFTASGDRLQYLYMIKNPAKLKFMQSSLHQTNLGNEE
ncbi:sigma-70 family RNA polymerase sigma factor [Paenibacillus sp. HJL G12]|uniref:Sigma-70 family RNA polymerase sigma factor n=1 Tax=Paenibacillus dendrobii TaxID=2691084 RepID=A0A7X3LI35_9BACL|nr:sigma-70 family RNA polymerase sigma factor [Paenibacillus dendrobii]MWV46536.1 sigma-70 family RNA polymerase sigma factor [Paenibacillus dendrobii]